MWRLTSHAGPHSKHTQARGHPSAVVVHRTPTLPWTAEEDATLAEAVAVRVVPVSPHLACTDSTKRAAPGIWPLVDQSRFHFAGARSQASAPSLGEHRQPKRQAGTIFARRAPALACGGACARSGAAPSVGHLPHACIRTVYNAQIEATKTEAGPQFATAARFVEGRTASQLRDR